MRGGNQLIDVSSAAHVPSSTIPLFPHDNIFHIQVLCTSLIQFYSITLIKNLILMMQKQSCLLWWNLLMQFMDVNWFDTKLIKLSPVTVKGVGPSSAPTGRWWGTLMKVIWTWFCWKDQHCVSECQKDNIERGSIKGKFFLCIDVYMDSFFH